ncbi:MAG: right-handed parallel beta-helix repeat-containing protein [Clostridia bacterium]|nr:right-handed parallel beta-helix repeat-containing protein [Clostridia bacterium]
MKYEAVINVSEFAYESLQAVIDQSEPYSIIYLEDKSYHEGFHIDKPLVLIGQEHTAFVLGKEQILIEDDIVFRQIKFRFHETKNDVHMMATKGRISCHHCDFYIEKQSRPLYAALWLEKSGFYSIGCRYDASASILKSIHGGQVMFSHNQVDYHDQNIAIEAHQIENIQLSDNHFHVKGQMLSVTKSGGVLVTDNTVEIHESSQMIALLKIEEIFNHEDVQILNNRISGHQTGLIAVAKLNETDQSVLINDNVFLNDKMILNVAEVKGQVFIENNRELHEFHGRHLEHIQLKDNQLNHLELIRIEFLKLYSSTVKGLVRLQDCGYVDLVENKLINEDNHQEVLFCQYIGKMYMRKNFFKSLDHGFTFLNGGDNLELSLVENTFEKCRKRAVNVASTTQRKFVKTIMTIKHNIFTDNEHGIYIDDQNLKSCEVLENYFSGNRTALLLIGGKSTSQVKISDNYLGYDRQTIEVRNSRGVTLMENECADSNVVLRGCDDMLIQKNHFSPGGNHQIAVKSVGYLTIMQNEVLNQRSKQEQRELMSFFNITAYDRKPAIKIQNNYSDQEGHLNYPDSSLLELLTYQIRTSDNLKAMSFDDALKQDFLFMTDRLEKIALKISHEAIELQMDNILKRLNLTGLADKETNDIYKLIAKGKETIAMLDMYLEIEDKHLVEERILNVLRSFDETIQVFYETKKNKQSDLLNAQIKMLENYLKE